MPDRTVSQRRLILDTVLLGAAGAAAALLFTWLVRLGNDLLLGGIAGYYPPGLPTEGGVATERIGPYGLWLVPLSTALGGLIVGFLATRFAPETEGHGTDTAVRAFHRAGGLLRARVAPLKMIASAITIGSGGSAGREGPVALVAASIGSWYGTISGRSERDRRLLLLIGLSAGLAAIFRSPIGTAFFAVEVLYSNMEFESRALLYTMIASIVAYALNGLVVGWRPLFLIPAGISLSGPLDYAWYVVLGVAAGIFATLLPAVFYQTRDLFRRLPVAPMWRPAIGGLGVGIIALAVPQVLGGGYGWMQDAIDGRIAVLTLVVLLFAKLIAMSLTVGSGGSGGIFAPSLFLGGMLGGLLAAALHQPPAPFVVVGMAAVFAGAAHIPMATLMMVTEMTGGYTLLVPAALAVMLSYLVQSRLSQRLRYRSMYETQVSGRADSAAHRTEHLGIALRILREGKLASVSGIGPLDLMTLLKSGIPVELPDGRRLGIGVLRPDSTLLQDPAGGGRAPLGEGAEIVAVLRGAGTTPVGRDQSLQPGDRVIVLGPPRTLEQLIGKHLDPSP